MMQASQNRLSAWFAALAGPAAWTLHELLSYFLAAFGCGAVVLLHLLTLGCLALAVGGGYIAWRQRFSAGALLAALFAFAILLEWVPALAVPPCR